MQVFSRTARSAALLLGLLVAFFLLMSLQVNRGRTLSTARGAVRGVASPVQRILGAVSATVGGTWGHYRGLLGAAAENERLRRRIDDLERRLAAGEASRRENRRLRGLLGANARLPGTWIEGRVVARAFNERYQTVTINRGRRDGLRVDAPVTGPGGVLVGRVLEVSPWTSLVQLVTDPLAGVGARLEESRVTGFVSGDNGPRLRLEYITTRIDVGIGERVVTSGEDGIYPPDLVIGRVTSVEVGPTVPGVPTVPLTREETALFRIIEVQPAIDVLRLENVLVRQAPEPPPAPAESEPESQS